MNSVSSPTLLPSDRFIRNWKQLNKTNNRLHWHQWSSVMIKKSYNLIRNIKSNKSELNFGIIIEILQSKVI